MPGKIFAHACLAASMAFAASHGAAQTLHVQRVDILDRHGFDQTVPAASILVPVGWQDNGGIAWGIQDNCNHYGYNFSWFAAEPSGAAGVAVLPIVRWVGQQQDYNACPILEVNSARQLLGLLAAEFVPGSRVLDYRPRPDLLKEAGLQNSRHDNGYGVVEQSVDAGEVLIAFIDDNGHEMRGVLSAAVIGWRSTFRGASYGMPDTVLSGGSNLPAFLHFARNGTLDFGLGETVRKTITPNRQWAQAIARHHYIIDKDRRQTAFNISQIYHDANQEINRIIHEGYQERSEIQDRIHREQIEAIRGVETFHDPINGGTVQLDNSFDQAWQLEDGTFVLTNDAFFEPWRDLGMDGDLLQVVQ